MQIKIEKKDSKERLTVEVSNASAAKVLANWLGAAHFRVSAEVVFGDEAPTVENEVSNKPAASAPPAAKRTKVEPNGEHVKAVRATLTAHPKSTPKAIVEGTGLEPADVKACLAWLKDAGQVTSEGRGPGTAYSVAEGA